MIITAQLMGGIGNQMFQIAAAKGLTMKLKELYPEDYKSVKCTFDFNKCGESGQGNVPNTYKNDFFKNIPNQNIGNLKHKYKENGFSYSEIAPTKKWSEGLEIFGYFQSSKYFHDFKNEISKLFHFSKERVDRVCDFVNNIGNDNNITSVHVRRGDYLNNPGYHPTCSVDYYKKSMDIIGDNNTKFIFVSDDIEWCKDNFKAKNIYYSPFKNEIDDLCLLVQSNNHIIANSSFSWWGAYLCPHNNKVIAPRIWFGPKGPKDVKDIYETNWIVI